jgi:hypothetical protein
LSDLIVQFQVSEDCSWYFWQFCWLWLLFNKGAAAELLLLNWNLHFDRKRSIVWSKSIAETVLHPKRLQRGFISNLHIFIFVTISTLEKCWTIRENGKKHRYTSWYLRVADSVSSYSRVVDASILLFTPSMLTLPFFPIPNSPHNSQSIIYNKYKKIPTPIRNNQPTIHQNIKSTNHTWTTSLHPPPNRGDATAFYTR